MTSHAYCHTDARPNPANMWCCCLAGHMLHCAGVSWISPNEMALVWCRAGMYIYPLCAPFASLGHPPPGPIPELTISSLAPTHIVRIPSQHSIPSNQQCKTLCQSCPASARHNPISPSVLSRVLPSLPRAVYAWANVAKDMWRQ